MPAIVVPKDGLSLGPGYLLWAPLASTLPTNTVAGSLFTDTWPGAWLPLGITDAGSDFKYALTVNDVDAEEYLDPIAKTTVSRAVSMAFSLANINMTNFKRAVNGGSIATTGSGATSLNAFTPPVLGAEVRCMLGWESTDSTERMIGYQCFQVGSIDMPRRKGSAKAVLPVEFAFEQPATGAPFSYWTAGTVRG